MFGLGFQELLVMLVPVGLIGGIIVAAVYFIGQGSRARGAHQPLPGSFEARRPLDAAGTQLAIERAKAEKKSPVVLWLVNIVWPGLGNIVVGQTGLGILFGLLQWVCIGVAILTLGFGSILGLINWVVACTAGHSRINREYSEALARIQAAASS